jgi:hypothetical protein
LVIDRANNVIFTDVIPAKAGIQEFKVIADALDPGLRRGDDFNLCHSRESGNPYFF